MMSQDVPVRMPIHDRHRWRRQTQSVWPLWRPDDLAEEDDRESLWCEYRRCGGGDPLPSPRSSNVPVGFRSLDVVCDALDKKVV